MEEANKNELIGQTLGLGKMDELTDEELLAMIYDRVNQLFTENPELLFSYLYRLDVLEEKIKWALSPTNPIPPIDGLTQLIFERQKQRIASKKKYKQDPIEGWEF